MFPTDPFDIVFEAVRTDDPAGSKKQFRILVHPALTQSSGSGVMHRMFARARICDLELDMAIGARETRVSAKRKPWSAAE